MKKHYVFVYGTLRSNLSNHFLLEGAEEVSKQCWTAGTLYDVGCGYPAMAVSSKNQVYGELYKVSDEELSKLDRLEGYKEKSLYNHYERIEQTVYTDQGSCTAYVYVYTNDRVTHLKEVSLGDWKYELLLKKDSLFYFAYGSCMDDKRFYAHGVAHLFTNIVGAGVLRNYKLAFTRKVWNGGRADIVEVERGVVEGKVYKLNREAVDYLFEREGVKYNTYRPTFVDVKTSTGVLKDVLTYVVIDKQTDTAPPGEYAEEILRGGNGILSEPYVKQLTNDLIKKFGMRLPV